MRRIILRDLAVLQATSLTVPYLPVSVPLPELDELVGLYLDFVKIGTGKVKTVNTSSRSYTVGELYQFSEHEDTGENLPEREEV
jgi:hypothetical protein